MITYEQAHAIAVDYLRQEGIELALLEEETIEKPYGWIFWYQSKEYVETRQAALIGTPPFMVEKEGGEVTFLQGRPNIDFTYDWESGIWEQRIVYEDRLRAQNAAPIKDTE